MMMDKYCFMCYRKIERMQAVRQLNGGNDVSPSTFIVSSIFVVSLSMLVTLHRCLLIAIYASDSSSLSPDCYLC